MFRRYVAVVLIVIAAAGYSEADSRPFSLKAGIGYDYLSQRYFMDSLAVAGIDTVLTRYELSSDYLNDLKGSLELAYKYAGENLFDLSTRLEQTQDITRLKLTSNWLARWTSLDLRWRNQIEWRHQADSASSTLGSYVSGATNLKARRFFSQSTAVWGQFLADGTDFRSDLQYGYDFYRVTAKLGLEQSFGILSTASLHGFMTSREVSDSVTLNYDGYGIEGTFSGLLSRLEIDFLTRWEKKDYNRAANDDDYNRFELDSRSRLDLGRQLFSRQVLELEMTSFDPNDPLNDDYSRLGGTLTMGVSLGSLEIDAGPDFELLRQPDADSSSAEDYDEIAAQVGMNYISVTGLFASVEHRLGKRSLGYPNEYQSDFSFYDLSMLTSWPISRGLELSLILSATWEWHDQETEDNRSLLLSSGLTYRF
ncbi:MAG: hypothetical protein IPH75_06705 [bacterium]|nr:hypothetical protein [bacterium]